MENYETYSKEEQDILKKKEFREGSLKQRILDLFDIFFKLYEWRYPGIVARIIVGEGWAEELYLNNVKSFCREKNIQQEEELMEAEATNRIFELRAAFQQGKRDSAALRMAESIEATPGIKETYSKIIKRLEETKEKNRHLGPKLLQLKLYNEFIILINETEFNMFFGLKNTGGVAWINSKEARTLFEVIMKKISD